MRHTLRFLLILFALFSVFCAGSSLLIPAQYADTFSAALPDKLDRLASVDGKRIVVIGGSSVPFSLRSDLLEDAFPEYKVVDLGLYGRVGTCILLELIKEDIHEGDILILSPEQEADALSTAFDPEVLLQACDGRLSLLPRLTRHPILLAALPAFSAKKLGYFLSAPPAPTGVYARSAFNAYGDIAYPGRTGNTLPLGYDPDTPILFDVQMLTPAFVEALNQFAREAAAKGAKVYYRFPPMNAAALDAAPRSIDRCYDALDEALLFPILGSPHRSILDKAWFYDSNFHLNAAGAILFTRGYIEDLKILFGDTTPTEIPMPQPPAPVPAAVHGDDSQAACFTYAQTEGGLCITGLAEPGLTRVILPTAYQGQPVVAISDTAFRDNPRIGSVTIQENIRLLPNGLFSGCTHLRELILTAEDPAACTVGDGLRQGSDFRILVPQADRYRRSYFWQPYASYLSDITTEPR